MKKLITLFFAGAFILGFITLNAQETSTYTDDFSADLDYLTQEIPAGSIWEGYRVNGGLNETQDCELNALQAVDGALRFESHSGNYEWGGQDDGPFLYRTVPGGIDFDIIVQGVGGDFVSFSGRAEFLPHNSMGILVTTAGDDYALAVDFLYAMLFEAWSIHSQLKSIDDGEQTEYNTSLADTTLLAYPWIKLSREGNVFTKSISMDGITWIDNVSVERADLEGLDLLVGLSQDNFTTIDAAEVGLLSPGYATGILDNFSLTHEKVASVSDIKTTSFKTWSLDRDVVLESSTNEFIQSARLYSIDGRLISTLDNVNDHRCQFNNVRNGLFIVTAEIGGETMARKVVVR